LHPEHRGRRFSSKHSYLSPGPWNDIFHETFIFKKRSSDATHGVRILGFPPSPQSTLNSPKGSRLFPFIN
jgi:hypothetical protein